jgi:hypothetical protein
MLGGKVKSLLERGSTRVGTGVIHKHCTTLIGSDWDTHSSLLGLSLVKKKSLVNVAKKL